MGFLSEALIFFVAALIVVPLCKRLGLSPVLGYLGAGLMIGPAGLALVGDADDVLAFAELGVALFLFLVGLELQPRRLWIMRRAVFGFGSLQMLLTTVVLGLLLAATALTGLVALVVAFAVALSSTAFVLQLLGEQQRLQQPHGRAAFGVLLLQDVAVVPAMIAIGLTASQAGGASGVLHLPGVAGIVLGCIAARFLLRPALRWIAQSGIHELFTAAGLTLVIGAALAMHSVGLSMALGAFVAGLMVADSPYRHQLETDINPFKGLLIGLFFIAVGMSVDISLLLEAPLTVLGLTGALMTLKALLIYPLGRWHGLTRPESLRTALVLAQGGEFAFVLLSAATAAALIDQDIAALSILVVTLSMALTPVLVGLGERILRQNAPERAFDAIEGQENSVVIAGFGRVGQIVARVLTMRHIPFTGLEIDPGRVDFMRRYGHRAA